MAASSSAMAAAQASFRTGTRVSQAHEAHDTPRKRTSFVCQRCLQPLKIDPSFSLAISEHMYAELTLQASPTADFGVDHDEAVKLDQYVPPIQLNESSNTAEFTLVDEAGEPVSTISKTLRQTAELFDLISSNGEIDHPLCEECTDTLLETMDRQLKLAEEEAQEYQAFLNKLDHETEDDGQLEALQKELEGLKTEEQKLKTDLSKLKADQELAEKDLQEQIEEKDKLEKEELKYWKEYSKYKRELLLAEDEYRSYVDCRLRYTQVQLEKLKKVNIFNCTFHIWHTGHFATINGFRLGRLPSIPVEWNEINAAWGQTALLLSCLSKAIGIDTFQRYQLVPYGNYSYLKVLADDKSLPLYCTGGFRMIFDSKFDLAMVAFLDCLQQFAVEVEKQGQFSLPYEMEKGKIRDNNTGQWYSIKLQFNSEDSWTKALRYMLTNLKWGLAYISTRYSKQEEMCAQQQSQSTTQGNNP